ncbi:class I SAM-dependent methyltransferase [Streptomyces barkulensis]|uniref:class I SAM-dependent methyltransferase n=1 Tax=Streptomyces barkulensis TaxID=1257026 RepID=UPI000C6ECC44|nr:methyltransferase domain-containing protein [Streptomyces barkulensis]
MNTRTEHPAEQIRTAWDALAPGFDRHTTPHTLRYGEQILDEIAIGPGTRFLDVAAGSGALALPAARRGARVVAVDIAPAMVERLAARAREEGLDHVRALVMDGEHLDLEDDAFDLSASLNGVSLFPDLERGLAEMARVTRPGGTVLVAAFGSPQDAEFIAWTLGALRAAVPGFAGMPANPPPLPFRLADPNRFSAVLREAGLVGESVHRTVTDTFFASAAELLDTVRSSHPLGARWVTGLTGSQAAEVRRILEGMLRERSGGAPGAVLHTALNIGTGRSPAP